jgi:hypothetical protein
MIILAGFITLLLSKERCRVSDYGNARIAMPNPPSTLAMSQK